MHTCYLVGAAPQATAPATQPGDFIIAADGGCNHLHQWGQSPDFIVGDFDSLAVELPPNIARRQSPTHKNETDLTLAWQEGFARGFRRFVLVGAWGGRPDHSFANLQLLLAAAQQGCFVELQAEGFNATMLTDSGELLLRGEGTVSVFAFDGTATGVTIEGLEYALKGATLAGNTPLGVSNQLHGEGRITAQNGALLVFYANGIEPLVNL